MAHLNMELTDHIKEIKEVCPLIILSFNNDCISLYVQYLTTVSDHRGGVACPLEDMVFREGYVIVYHLQKFMSVSRKEYSFCSGFS